MRDDFQIPNFGQAPPSTYEQTYFNRVVRNIETTFTAMRAKGQGIFAKLFADSIEVKDLDVTGDAVFEGTVGAIGNIATTGDFVSTGAQIYGDSNGTNFIATDSLVAGQDVSAGGTIWGDSIEAQSSLKSYGTTSLRNTTINGTSTLNGNVAITGNLAYTGIPTHNGLPCWETIESGTFSLNTFKNFLNLDPFVKLRLHIHAVPVSSGTTACYMRYSTDNGATWVVTAGEYYNNLLYNSEGSATPAGVATTATIWDLSFGNSVAINPYGIDIKQDISNWNRPYQTQMHGTVDTYNGTTIFKGMAMHRTGQALASNALHFSFIGDATTFNGYYFLEGIRG